MPFLALLGLLLLPGLTVVAAGWAYVPFLSIAYWVITWGWLSPLGPGRESFLLASLFAFAGLGSLRFLKPLGLLRPGAPALGLAAAAAAHVLPFFFWTVAPGLSAGFASSSTLLLTWHDGIPSSLRPLYPMDGFGHDGFGLPALAADLSLLSGLPAHRAELLASLTAEGLVTLALFTVLKTRRSALAAATTAALGGSVLAGLRLLCGGSEGSVLALALALAGAGLAARAHGWPTGVASGLFLGAGIAAEPSVGLAVALALAVVALRAGSGRRVAQVEALALVFALPVLWKTRAFHMGASLGENALFLLATLGVLAGVWFGSAAVESSRARIAAVGVLAVAVMGVDGSWRSSRVRVTPAMLAEARALTDGSGYFVPLCREDEVGRAWLPAMTGRPVRPVWVPATFAGLLAPGDAPCLSPSVPPLTFSDEGKAGR